MKKYLVGDFSDLGSEFKFREVVNTDNIIKQDLAGVKDSSGFQVINLITMEYFDPKTNSWEKIKQI